MNFVELIGILAGIATTGSFIPQAHKVYKTKKTEDLSLAMFMCFNTGLFLWIIYGVRMNAISIILANGVTLVLGMYILIMKIKHG